MGQPLLGYLRTGAGPEVYYLLRMLANVGVEQSPSLSARSGSRFTQCRGKSTHCKLKHQSMVCLLSPLLQVIVR